MLKLKKSFIGVGGKRMKPIREINALEELRFLQYAVRQVRGVCSTLPNSTFFPPVVTLGCIRDDPYWNSRKNSLELI